MLKFNKTQAKKLLKGTIYTDDCKISNGHWMLMEGFFPIGVNSLNYPETTFKEKDMSNLANNTNLMRYEKTSVLFETHNTYVRVFKSKTGANIFINEDFVKDFCLKTLYSTEGYPNSACYNAKTEKETTIMLMPMRLMSTYELENICNPELEGAF